MGRREINIRGFDAEPSLYREPFSSFRLAGLKDVDGFGELAGAPGCWHRYGRPSGPRVEQGELTLAFHLGG
jgi:hypothetical protein